MPTEPAMDEQHEALLKTACGYAEDESLPERLVEWYWVFKRAADRISLPLTERDLMWPILFSQTPVPPPPEQNFLALAKNVSVGAPVEAKWKWGHWKPGWYQGVTRRGMVLVQLDDGTAEVREMRPEAVRLPVEEEVGA